MVGSVTDTADSDVISMGLSANSDGQYGYMWWITEMPEVQGPVFYANGFDGQKIYVVPSRRADDGPLPPSSPSTTTTAPPDRAPTNSPTQAPTSARPAVAIEAKASFTG